MKLIFLILFLCIFGIYAVLIYGAKCGQSEYQSTAGECCPMCSIGEVVLRDCHGDYSTTCKPCVSGTYMNEPNGLTKCFPCKTCDAGLYVLEKCSTVKNTICEVLDGYYCVDYAESECTLGMKHSECNPGQRIKIPGTKALDTVCEPCPPGFYSPAGVNCFKWTNCSLMEIKDKEGTSISDVTCKPKGRNRSGLIAAVVILTLVIVLICVWNRVQAHSSRTKLKSPVEETNPHCEASPEMPRTSPTVSP